MLSLKHVPDSNQPAILSQTPTITSRNWHFIFTIVVWDWAKWPLRAETLHYCVTGMIFRVRHGNVIEKGP